jgi:DNA repair exonuclease SbcCD ATPase subunit
MKKIQFRRASAKNFLCFGPEGIELDFTSYGNVVLIKGINLDTGNDVNPSSNGAGKSSIQDIISYAIYGKTVKSPKKMTHDKVINSHSKEKLVVELEFDDYKIVRSREPNKLQLFYSKDHIWDKQSDISVGATETQAKIEKIIGLTHHAFCNIVIFDDKDTYSFLEADAKEKRDMVENLLGLEVYREYHEEAKNLLKEAKKVVQERTKEYERIQIELDACDKRIAKIKEQEVLWGTNKKAEITTLQGRLTKKQEELQNTDAGAALEKYELGLAKVDKLTADAMELQEKQKKITLLIKEAYEKHNVASQASNAIAAEVQKVTAELAAFRRRISQSQALITSLQGLKEGQKCNVCHGEISKENYQNVLTHEENIIQSTNAEIEKSSKVLEDLQAQAKLKNDLLAKLMKYIGEAKEKEISLNAKVVSIQNELTTLSKISKPDMSATAKVLESEITELRSNLKSKQDELKNGSPYKEILAAALVEKKEKDVECEVKVKDLREAEADLPYYEYWVEGFGDKGIRMVIVEGSIPALNSHINYWMQILIDGKIDVKFDAQLTSTITRSKHPVDYPAMSNGEQRRVNLSVPHAFAYVQMLNFGRSISLVFLDEVTGGGIDKAGVAGVFKMICELAKDRQVFVTTHNEYLLNLMQGCETITLTKKDDITTLTK